MWTWLGYFVLISLSRSAGIVSELAMKSALPFSTWVTSDSTLSPNFCTIVSGRPAGCASVDHTLKFGLRTIFISLFGAYSTHLYGPVPGGGMLRFFAGVLAGKMNAKGKASWSRNSGSGRARWNVMSLPLIVMPCERLQVFGVFTHASPPLMALYHDPAFGLSPILNRRSKLAVTSFGVTVCPFENLMPV